MMNKNIGLPSLVLGTLLAFSLFASVHSGCLGGTCDVEQDCIENFNQVHSLSELSEFLKKIDDGLANQHFTAKNVKNCLGFDSSSEIRDKIRAFLEIIEVARQDKICSFTYKIFDLDWSLSPFNKDNKKLRLAPWWDKFVKQVILKCESTMGTKLDINKPDKEVMKGVVSLANSFDWQNLDNFLRKSSNVVDEDQNWISANAVEKTSKKISELEDVFFEVDTKPISKQPRYDTTMDNKQLTRLQEMFKECNYIGSYRKWLVDPLLDLSNLGYLDSSLLESFKNYQYADVWLSSFKTCALLKHVNVLKLSDGAIRLKLGTVEEHEGMIELDAKMLVTDTLPVLPRMTNFNYPIKLDTFDELDANLLEMIPSMDNKSRVSKHQSNNAVTLKNIIYSEEFLKKIVDFIKSTNLFEPPIERGLQFTAVSKPERFSMSERDMEDFY